MKFILDITNICMLSDIIFGPTVVFSQILPYIMQSLLNYWMLYVNII